MWPAKQTQDHVCHFREVWCAYASNTATAGSTNKHTGGAGQPRMPGSQWAQAKSYYQHIGKESDSTGTAMKPAAQQHSYALGGVQFFSQLNIQVKALNQQRR